MILVDADACPVKEEIYASPGAPASPSPSSPTAGSACRPSSTQVVVGDGFDAADDWIAAHAGPATIVVTGDILLADRCVKAGATVLGHNGRPFTRGNIGSAVAARALAEDARAMSWAGDGPRAGPPPFTAADRSRFLQALDAAVQRLARARPR